MAYPIVELVIATTLLVAGATTDVLRRRIPNAINALVLAAGLAAQGVGGGWRGALSALAAAALILAALFPAWQRGRLGGGDVKLAAATAAWVGLGRLVPFALVTALAGAAVAVACAALSSRQARRQIRANLVLAAAAGATPEVPIRSGGGRVSVPYGVAVAAGALVVLWGGG
jgi:prepilin peptidase CpaA